MWGAPRIKPRPDGSRRAGRPCPKRDYRLVGWLQTVIRYRQDTRVEMCLVLVENLDDVAVGSRIQQLKNIPPSRQDLATGNLDLVVECHNSFLVPLVCHHFG